MSDLSGGGALGRVHKARLDQRVKGRAQNRSAFVRHVRLIQSCQQETNQPITENKRERKSLTSALQVVKH